MRQHIYYLQKLGPAEHARKRKFSSIRGMRRHLYGLATFAGQIEPEYGTHCLKQLDKVNWPL